MGSTAQPIVAAIGASLGRTVSLTSGHAPLLQNTLLRPMDMGPSLEELLLGGDPISATTAVNNLVRSTVLLGGGMFIFGLVSTGEGQPLPAR